MQYFQNLCGMHGRDDEITSFHHEALKGMRPEGAEPVSMEDWIAEGRGKGKGKGTPTKEELGQCPSQGSQFPPPGRMNGGKGNSANSSPEKNSQAGSNSGVPIILDTQRFPPPRTLDEAMEQGPGNSLALGPGNYIRGPEQILEGVLAIERICLGDLTRWKEKEFADGEAKLSITIDDPGVRYCIASSPNTPLVTGFFGIEIPDIDVEEAKLVLGNEEMRKMWDPDCEFQTLIDLEESETRQSEVISSVMKAPWPFWDRDILIRRWHVPLEGSSGSGGFAFLSQSIDDPLRFPRRDGRIRATVHMAGHLIRPLCGDEAVSGRAGVKLTCVNKIDIGGIAPPWSQSMLCRFASRSAENWVERLRTQCFALRDMELGAAEANAGASDMPESEYSELRSQVPEYAQKGGAGYQEVGDSTMKRDLMGQ